METEVKDYLGTPIKLLANCVRVAAYSHDKYFEVARVEAIDTSREYGDCVGILGKGNSRIGWTYPWRIIVQDSVSVDLEAVGKIGRKGLSC